MSPIDHIIHEMLFMFRFFRFIMRAFFSISFAEPGFSLGAALSERSLLQPFSVRAQEIPTKHRSLNQSIRT